MEWSWIGGLDGEYSQYDYTVIKVEYSEPYYLGVVGWCDVSYGI